MTTFKDLLQIPNGIYARDIKPEKGDGKYFVQVKDVKVYRHLNNQWKMFAHVLYTNGGGRGTIVLPPNPATFKEMCFMPCYDLYLVEAGEGPFTKSWRWADPSAYPKANGVCYKWSDGKYG